MDCKDRAPSLGLLANNVLRYAAELRLRGFACVHVNDDWIAQHCRAVDLGLHQRYLIESAREALATGNKLPDFGDEQTCQSKWLNEMKAARLRTHGPDLQLRTNCHKSHLAQLSPGWREFMRVRSSSAPQDRAHREAQGATFVDRQFDELKKHKDAISRITYRLTDSRDELSLQSFFASELITEVESFGARERATMQRNQFLQCDEQVAAVTFAIGENCYFVILPVVVLSSPVGSRGVEGTLGVGYRLMSEEAIDAPKFDFDAVTVLYLDHLLPNKFNGYGRFVNVEELGLNLFATITAVRILLPDVLETLRTTAGIDR